MGDFNQSPAREARAGRSERHMVIGAMLGIAVLALSVARTRHWI